MSFCLVSATTRVTGSRSVCGTRTTTSSRGCARSSPGSQTTSSGRQSSRSVYGITFFVNVALIRHRIENFLLQGFKKFQWKNNNISFFWLTNNWSDKLLNLASEFLCCTEIMYPPILCSPPTRCWRASRWLARGDANIFDERYKKKQNDGENKGLALTYRVTSYTWPRVSGTFDACTG